MNIMRMKKRSRLGFTLVELIVVIAILAILAGVAIPVYSGYIKKANEAADQQLLGAVNTALAAACIENNMSMKNLPDGSATIQLTGKCITGVSVSQTGIDAATNLNSHPSTTEVAMLGVHYATLNATPTDVSTSFTKYFAGNETTELKYYKSANDFEFKEGSFRGKGIASSGGMSGPTVGTTTLSNGNTLTTTFDEQTNEYTFTVENENGETLIYTANKDSVDSFIDSTFGNNMTVEGIMGNVGTVTTSASGVLNNPANVVDIIGEDALRNLYGFTDEDLTDKTKLTNALVLKLAGDLSGVDSNDLMSDIQDQTFKNSFQEAIMNNDQSTMVTDATIAYALMMGYVNSDTGKSTVIDEETGQTAYEYFVEQSANLLNASGGTQGVMMVAEMMGTILVGDVFEDYIVNQAGTDLGGFLGAMDVLNSNASTLLTGNDVIANGFGSETNSDLLAILSGILGG